jgi:tetratricopeptide (TPR) repeat protein
MTADIGLPPGSHAVLIGVSEYEDGEFRPIRAARNSLRAMQALLTDPALCRWPPELITVITDPASASDLAVRIADITEITTGVLLLYYVGHGVLSTRGELCLTVTSTRPNRPKLTGLPWETLADVLRTCPARIRLTILDCCFAGQAIETLGAHDEVLADITHVRGVYTLAATTRNRTAHVPPASQQDTACTSFTGELQALILSGISGKPAQLTFSDIFPELRQRLQAKGLPAPSQRGTDTVIHFPFTANAAVRASQLRQVRFARLAPSLEVAIPRQLPAAVAGFTGRDAELEALTRLLEQAARPDGAMVIAAIDGTAGVGKTELAVQWAQRASDRFPGGQLYVNLRGFDPAGPPMAPAEAVRGFLDAFEVPAERIPFGLDAKVGLYRTLLSGRRVLVVLDNAHDADQIWPLLPGSPGSMVVVTSRNEMTGLSAAKGAMLLTLDVLSHAEADEMLTGRLGPDRAAAEPQAVQEIIDRCARLPIALSIVAARAATHRDFPLAALADELRDAEGRLPALDAGEAAASVAAVFSWSYRELSDQAARLFRLLGLHPGPDITAHGAASLAAVPLTAARPMLTELTRAHLITEHARGRFTFHDLLRDYAVTQTRTRDTDADRNAALQRMLDHYLHTAQAAWELSYPHQQQTITLRPPLPGVTPEEPADYPAAWAWFTAEYPVLLAAIQLAAAAGHHTHAWQLSHTLVPFFERQEHWHDFAAAHYTALKAAEHHDDQQGQAHAHLGIGHARARIDRFDEARPHLQDALRLFEELGDPAGQAEAHFWLGMTFFPQDRYDEALAHFQQAVGLTRTGGYQRGLAAALNGLGWVNALLGNAQQALKHCRQSLALFQDLRDRWGEAAALDSIGYACNLLGRPQEAASYFEQALAIDRELGDLYCQATDYDRLGDAFHAAGNTIQARNAWQLALDILDQLGGAPRISGGYAVPDDIRAKLRHDD